VWTFVLVDREWLTPDRLARLSAPDGGLRLARAFPSHLVYQVQPRGVSGPETLEPLTSVVAGAAGRPWEACLTLRNPGLDFVALYPARLLRLEMREPGTARSTSAERWLPLDLTHVECLGLREPAGSIEILGTVVGAGRAHRLRVASGDAPRRLEPVLLQ
jgi:hypothetical protein